MLTIPRYPRATENRVPGHDKSVIGMRKKFLKAAFINFALLQLLFFGLFSYLFGSIYQQAPHVHNLNVLFVDYDSGIVGTALKNAYASLEGHGFPTLEERTPGQYPTPDDIERQVCSTKYWAALYTSPGATTRLENALAGGSGAQDYNRSDVLTYIWNEARYSAVVDADISDTLQSLSSAARLSYTSTNGTGAMKVLAASDTAAISVFADPWHLTSVNIQPTTQGARLIYNTLVIILILIQEFFYLGTINGLYVQFKIYSRLYPHRIILYRNGISLAYTCVGSLCTTGAIWAFRAGWNVNANQFVLSWMTLWIFAHANFLSLDVFTVWLPAPYVPMALIMWIVFNVASILVPFELSGAFYKWAYVMPAHEAYQVLTDIWSGGCAPTLHYSLPILFSLEVSGLFLSGVGIYRRCHYAILAEEAQEAAFGERLNAAMAFERKRDAERIAMPAVENTPEALERAETADRNELAEVIREEDDELKREKTKANTTCNFGPSWDLAFKETEKP